MAKTLTLEEAAQKLGLTPEQFKTHLKTHKDFKSIRPLMGGATMHFRAQDIDELGRRLGLGSDPELKLGDSSSDPSLPAAGEDDAQVEIGREIVRGTGHSSARLKPSSSKRIKAAPPPEEHPLLLETSGDFIPLAPDEPARKPDSDVKLAKGSDSDVRLEKGSYQPQGTPTEEIDLAAEEKVRRKDKTEETYEMQDEAAAAKPTMKHQTSPKKPGSSSKLLKKPDSSSEFEMTLADDSGEEVDLGSLPVDVAGKEGKSGVNLKKPDDSGISLEKPDSDSEFELNLDSSSSVKISGPKSGKKLKDDSESEFELTLDDSSGEVGNLQSEQAAGQKDIFETDFDIPALDDESGSEAVVLEETDTDLESSDFDLALDESSVAEVEGESASEVVQLDEEAAEVEDASAEEELAGVEEEERAVAAGPLPPAKWGPLPALVMIPCVIVLFIVGLMAMELMHSQWGYRQSYRPSSAITRGIASMFYNDNEIPKE
jgi:hypothetical protein